MSNSNSQRRKAKKRARGRRPAWAQPETVVLVKTYNDPHRPPVIVPLGAVEPIKETT